MAEPSRPALKVSSPHAIGNEMWRVVQNMVCVFNFVHVEDVGDDG